MVRKFLFSLVVLSLTGGMYAQQTQLSNMEFGVQGGPGLGIFYNHHPLQNPRTPNKPAYGASVFGFTYQYNFPKFISLRAELNFERKGEINYAFSEYSSIDGSRTFINSYEYNRLRYITLPVMAQLHFGKKVEFFTNVGLYAGFRLNAERVSYAANDGTADAPVLTETKHTTDISNEIRQIDGGLVTGLGIRVPVWKSIKLSFEARNNLGFANLNNHSDLFQQKFYNNTTSFIFGLSVGLPKMIKNSGQLINPVGGK